MKKKVMAMVLAGALAVSAMAGCGNSELIVNNSSGR